MKVKQIVLAARPKGLPRLDNFRFEDIELPELKTGEVLVEGKFYSVDPYMRGRMNGAKSYAPPFQVDQPISGGIVAKVVDSKSNSLKEGDFVVGNLPWRTQTVSLAENLQKIDTSIAPGSYYLDILGMTGLTAYFGLMDICKPKTGETVVISGAAGAVGIVVGQIAKIQGCHVVGIAGSDDKTKLLKEGFGFDDAINYKTTSNMQEAIANCCPNGVDMYFDNVGGEISDAVIYNINFHARIALCGQISLYNNTEMAVGPRLQPMLLTKSVLMQGFIVGNYKGRFPEGILQLGKWLKDGQLKMEETFEHGFDKLPTAFLGLFKGDNIGKMIVKA